ncbi:reticulon-4b isoform X2 [Colossoma macropomum]|uniref:reticulon-4b isoform X2 n=1 Tax=Colossoma macropomum TaxID=42526 RepID=UPI0018647C4F|nr:reticulon-4b isoform X2 [Colossoma macropomum]
MADTEEVSSTTPNEVQEESAMGDLKGSTNEAAARRDNVGFAGGEQDETEVSEVKKGVETQAEDELPSPGEAEAVAVAAAAEAVLASALEPEPEPLVTSTVEEPLKKEEQEEEEVVVAQTADKAETELPEKTDLISHSEPSEVKESVQTEEQQVAVEVAAAAPVQEVTAPEAEEAPKPPPADEKEAIPKQPEQEEAVTAVPEPVAEPAAAVTSTVEPEEVTESPVEETELIQKQEDFNITAAAPAPVVKAEETFKSAPVEEEPTPAAPAPPSSHEPSLPAPAAAPAAPFPPLMQFTSVVDLLYWRDVKNTGVVFGASLLLLLSLSMCSIISVLSYVALALLSVTITFRIYKGILQAIQKSDEGHPFKQYLDQDVALPEEVVHKYSDIALGRINATIIELRRLFLVEDLVDSLKFAVFMWILTYVGALFNGLTLLILGLISAFSCPMLYEKHQTQIDHYIGLVNSQIKDVVGKIQAKMPGAKKKAE